MGATSVRRVRARAAELGARGERQALIVVSGLPRAGTSMVMRMLGAGGVALVTDGTRPPDVANPHGYFEDERVKRLRDDAAWLDGALGGAVKIVSPLLHLVPERVPLEVILVRRDVGEVLASQRDLLALGGVEPSAPGEDERLATIYAEHQVELERWLATRRGVRVLELRHCDVVECPEDAAARLCAFLRRSLDRGAMARAVDPSLYRHRAGPSSRRPV